MVRFGKAGISLTRPIAAIAADFAAGPLSGRPTGRTRGAFIVCDRGRHCTLFDWSGGGVGHNPVQYVSQQLSGKSGGDVATQTDESERESPLSAGYRFRVGPIVGQAAGLTVGARGRARIHVGSRRLRRTAVRTLYGLFRDRTLNSVRLADA